jgi:hypothetical protein
MTHGGRRNTRVVAAVCAGMAEAYMLGVLGAWRPGLDGDAATPGGAGTASAVLSAAMVVTAVGIVAVWLPRDPGDSVASRRSRCMRWPPRWSRSSW